MNITLSADSDLIERARRYAHDHDTSLNQLVRDHLERLVGDIPLDTAAEEFAATARLTPGDSSGTHGSAWNGRDALYAERIKR